MQVGSPEKDPPYQCNQVSKDYRWDFSDLFSKPDQEKPVENQEQAMKSAPYHKIPGSTVPQSRYQKYHPKIEKESGFGFFGIIRGIEGWQEKQLKVPYSTRKTWAGGLIAIILLVYCMASITTSGFNPFIYFRF